VDFVHSLPIPALAGHGFRRARKMHLHQYQMSTLTDEYAFLLSDVMLRVKAAVKWNEMKFVSAVHLSCRYSSMGSPG
jgi:hypothetical protein